MHCVKKIHTYFLATALVVFLMQLCYLRCHAQDVSAAPDLLFTHLTSREGLSYNAVNCVFKDSRGFVWIGTEEGFNRYDASSIKIYRHAVNRNSVVGNDIKAIAESPDGYLWIATTEGLSRLNTRTDSFDNYKHNIADTNSLADNQVKTLLKDNEGNLWIGTIGGLDKFDAARNSFLHFKNTNEADAKLRQFNNNISKIYQDSKQRLWICAYNGLFLFNKNTSKFTGYTAPLTSENKALDNLFTDIYEDHTHQLWACTWGGGLKKFDADKRAFETFKWNKHPEIPSADNVCLAIAESKDRYGIYQLWVAGQRGLGSFNRSTNTFTFYEHKITDPNTLTDGIVRSIFVDREQLLWISTSGGVNILDPNKQFFKTHRFNSAEHKDSLHAFGDISSIVADGNSLWVTTWYGNGVYLMDKHLNVLNRWHTVPAGSTNPESHQVSHLLLYGDDVWISTFNGLVNYNKHTKAFRTFLPDTIHKNNMPSARVERSFIDTHGVFWVLFYRAGIAWFDPHTGTFTPIERAPNAPAPHYMIYDITEDRTGNVWIACDSFLLRYDRKQNSFKRLQSTTLTPAIETFSFMNDSHGNLWIGTHNGISVVDPVTMKAEFITLQNGLQNDIIYGMQQDRHGRVWIATHNGLHLYDPATKKITVYKKDEGLENENINQAFAATADGRFLLGGQGYITEFYPDSASSNTAIPPVIITGFKIFGNNEPVRFDKDGDKSVSLTYKQNEFSFDMAVLNYTNPGQNTFYCKMEGFDNDWRLLQKGFVSYTNLDPGQYTFRVKGANNDGVMNETGDTIVITITPPFWKTWLFRILVILVLILVVTGITQWRINQVKQEEQRKTEFNRQVAELRMQALRAQMNPHFIFNSLNSILACIDQGKNAEARLYLTGFSKLVRIILENFSREKISLARELEAMRLYLEMEALRFAKDFEYKVSIDPEIETEMIQIAPMLIQPYIENALWHGLAHSQNEKKLTITVNEKNEWLEVVVEDNGIGRAAAMQLKQQHNTTRESVGLKNTEERLRIQNKRASVTIVDMHDAAGNATGTRVIILISIV